MIRPGALGLHMPSRRRADQRHRLQVQRQRAVPARFGHRQERLADPPAGVVDDDVQAAQGFQALHDRQFGGTRRGQVHHHGRHQARSRLGRGFLGRRAVDVRAPPRRTPLAAKARATARPSPPPAPVTRALLIIGR